MNVAAPERVLVVVVASASWMIGCSQQAHRPGETEKQSVAVESDRAWDGVFSRDSGWNGGDIANSIELGDRRTLWLFGDSIIGPVEHGTGEAVGPRVRVGDKSKMLRGAIAWHGASGKRGEPPAAMQFAATEAFGGVPAAPWIAPRPGLWPEGTWYWLMGDGAMVSQAESQERRRGAAGCLGQQLVLFAAAMGEAGNPDGVWNFRRIGGVIMTVENPADEPTAWHVEQGVNPVVQGTARFGEPKHASDSWGEAIVRWSGSLYVYGVRVSADGLNKSLLLARADDATLAKPEEWRYWTGAAWSGDPHAAAVVAEGVVDEFTVEPIRRGGRDELVLIQSEPLLGRRILARAASRPEGPWSEAKAVYEVNEVAGDKRLMTYAAKGHAALSREGELLVSYVVNSTEFGQIFADAGLYRPRFVGVEVGRLPEVGSAPGRVRE